MEAVGARVAVTIVYIVLFAVYIALGIVTGAYVTYSIDLGMIAESDMITSISFIFTTALIPGSLIVSAGVIWATPAPPSWSFLVVGLLP
ncbi:hypothetical protein HK405_013320, partial [Cladochytrium tenue]